ncbi:(deoxy)nucleoside triphosphate pyrophosphohydrolase, partial [Leifsonia sp. NPDC058292]|uniref:(deoxy)nucleoside triphosphate pyrophosphohydrolase n=1 Tax=Leifsonia sp. NPDC058292 TaxID=3346428 RepID=UPI0036DD2466
AQTACRDPSAFARHDEGMHANADDEPAPRPLGVVAAVIVADGRVLACRRAPHKAPAGSWEFPGGKVEPGESAPDSLVREIREELSVEITVGRLLDRSTTVVGGRPIDLSCYLAALAGAPPARSTDHDRLEWLSVPHLSGLEWSAPDLPAVQALIELGAPGLH